MAPLYQQIRRDLEAQIRTGALRAGARLPTEKELCEQHGVSRATAQRVLNELVLAGLATRRRRHGTFVADVMQQINLLSYVAPGGSAEKGDPGRHEVISSRIVRAVDAVIALPGSSPDTAVVELVRRKLDVLDQPRQIERHVILFSAAPDLLELDLEDFVSIGYFRAHEVPIDTVRIYLDPVIIGADDADLLASEPGSPALLRRRELRLDDGTAVESVATIIRPGAAQFFVELPFPTA